MEFGNTILTSETSDATTRLRYPRVHSVFDHEPPAAFSLHTSAPGGDDVITRVAVTGEKGSAVERWNPAGKTNRASRA